MKNLKKIIVITLLLLVYIGSSKIIDTERYQLTKKIPSNIKHSIKKYLYPYKLIQENEVTIENNKKNNISKVNTIQIKDKLIEKLAIENEVNLKKAKSDLLFKKTKEKKVKLFNKDNDKDGNYVLKIYSSKVNQITKGQNNFYPGSAYLDFYNDKLFLLSATGILGFSDKIENNIIFKQIKNNIDQFINEKHFKKKFYFSVKDLKIIKNKIYISFTNELKEDCWNTSIIVADLNFEEVNFKKLFEPMECSHSLNNTDNEFGGGQAGGRIVKLNEENILFSSGDYRNRKFAQDSKSVIGKIIQVNINSGDYKIVSIGHRNPQGLYYNKKKKYIISTEHGPMGGDEINLIKINYDKIPNYGWPIASYGEHYGGKNSKKNIAKYKKYPLYKSHKDHDFIEPIKYFDPAIGISEIVHLGKNKYIASSMKDKSIHMFEINKNDQVENLTRVEIGERIRDIIFNGKEIFLFLEDTASVAMIKYN